MPAHGARDLKYIEDPRQQAIDVCTRWLPRVALSVIFLNVGLQKFGSTPMWIRIFRDIGVGQWLRYLTGVMQVGGALLILIPPTFVAGILLLICTMVGAVVTWL